jgi:hypothetical protein
MRETSHFPLKKARLLSDVRDFLRGSHSGDFSTHLVADCPHHLNGIEGLTSLQSTPPAETFGVSAELLVQAAADDRRVNVDSRNHRQTIGELRQLRRENQTLRDEVKFLKRAAGWLAPNGNCRHRPFAGLPYSGQRGPAGPRHSGQVRAEQKGYLTMVTGTVRLLSSAAALMK